MLQHELTAERQKCDHGYFFGTTCEYCMLQRLSDAVGKHTKWQYDHLFGVVQGVNAYNSEEIVNAVREIQEYCAPRRKKK
jgi:hypothetical protein